MTIRLAQQRDNLLVKPPTTVKANGSNGKNKQMPLHVPEDPLILLADAAEAGDAQAFMTAYHLIDWSTHTPDEFERAIHWALIVGAHLAARSLAVEGSALYPDYAELQKAARILAPPKVIRHLPADPTIRANQDWLRGNCTAYRGQWVALQNGQLLATADSFGELTKRIAISPEILFTKVI